jgi:hypothetical protein
MENLQPPTVYENPLFAGPTHPAGRTLYVCWLEGYESWEAVVWGCKQSNAPFLNPYMKSSGRCPMATALGKLPNFPSSMFSLKQAIPSSGLDIEEAEFCRTDVS